MFYSMSIDDFAKILIEKYKLAPNNLINKTHKYEANNLHTNN